MLRCDFSCGFWSVHPSSTMCSSRRSTSTTRRTPSTMWFWQKARWVSACRRRFFSGATGCREAFRLTRTSHGFSAACFHGLCGPAQLISGNGLWIRYKFAQFNTRASPRELAAIFRVRELYAMECSANIRSDIIYSSDEDVHFARSGWRKRRNWMS